MVLLNTDQALAYLSDLSIDGRDVVIRVGPQDAAYPAGYTVFLTGTAERVEVGTRKHLVLCQVEKRPAKLDLEVYPYLPRAKVGRISAASYMCLVAGAAA